MACRLVQRWHSPHLYCGKDKGHPITFHKGTAVGGGRGITKPSLNLGAKQNSYKMIGLNSGWADNEHGAGFVCLTRLQGKWSNNFSLNSPEYNI